ncbi:3-oxoacyl-[acyl-carrier-protein] synthase-3 [Taibaiella chishuiensis]|uniref:3-oxoacyl-[acyl-carrier-protein] synthase-3 n=2 Tax=Taibaiella chishuiensis TaxID=1434707 RepID=A0A2P8D1R9_9BACT|nr:3-oxoacyl-[acyl-carrier-protein] synthase-3 [Taibaiella chishuiensis]
MPSNTNFIIMQKGKRGTVIRGSGSYIPERRVLNADFMQHSFYGPDGLKLPKENMEIIAQFSKITGIRERRYVTEDLVTSDIAGFAAQHALQSAGVDPESLDYIIVAHNFGDIKETNRRSEFVPTIASRVKHFLRIANPTTVAYDLPFGCAGWLQGVIQADYYIRSGDAKRVLVVGAETLSRICDPHDRDSMIYADGAGAIILETAEHNVPSGVLAHVTKSYSSELAYVLRMDRSINPDYKADHLFLKMNGRKLYEYALKTVPQMIRECLDKAGLSIDQVDKILIHQANEKMDDAILKGLYSLYGAASPPEGIMPMTIAWLGNSSVATLPTLYDLVCKGRIADHALQKGDNIIFVSVGAGVNMNALVYNVP